MTRDDGADCPACRDDGRVEQLRPTYSGWEGQGGPSGVYEDPATGQPHDHSPGWWVRRFRCTHGHSYEIAYARPCYAPCPWQPQSFPGPGLRQRRPR
jgi:hypothetical protein